MGLSSFQERSMSMFDPDARDRALTNHLNEILRHCRIGRVTKKVMVHGGQMVPLHLMPGAQVQSNGALTSA
jgi:hypothetical protein